jgi:hypothetical protein
MHASLVVVWLGTALVSALDYLGLSGLNHEGARLLDQGGIGDARWQALLIWSGLLADLALGLALLLRPGRAIYLSALLLMTAMTVIGTALQPTLWLHPGAAAQEPAHRRHAVVLAANRQLVQQA